MQKNIKLGLLAISLLCVVSVPLAMPAAHASPPITLVTSKSFYINGNLINIVVYGGNLYAQVNLYKYSYISGGWRGGLVGYFTIQCSVTWYGTAKATVTAYQCTNGYCYPVKTWDLGSVNLLETYIRQYLQGFFAALYYGTSLVSYVQSVIAPYIWSATLGSMLGVYFTYFLYIAI